MEVVPLAKVGELACQDGLDVLGLSGQDEADRRGRKSDLDAVWRIWRAVAVIDAIIEAEKIVFHLSPSCPAKPNPGCESLKKCTVSNLHLFSFFLDNILPQK